MVVEPIAGDKLEDNLNPIGRLYYSASTMICVPTSLAQETGLALGAQAGEERLAQVIRLRGIPTDTPSSPDPTQYVLEATSTNVVPVDQTRRRREWRVLKTGLDAIDCEIEIRS